MDMGGGKEKIEARRKKWEGGGKIPFEGSNGESE